MPENKAITRDASPHFKFKLGLTTRGAWLLQTKNAHCCAAINNIVGSRCISARYHLAPHITRGLTPLLQTKNAHCCAATNDAARCSTSRQTSHLLISLNREPKSGTGILPVDNMQRVNAASTPIYSIVNHFSSFVYFIGPNSAVTSTRYLPLNPSGARHEHLPTAFQPYSIGFEANSLPFSSKTLIVPLTATPLFERG